MQIMRESGAVTRFKSHWLGLALPVLGCFGGGSLYGWSGLMPAVQGAFGVGSASASMVFSFALASFTLGVLFSPVLLGRVPARLRLTTVAALAGVSLAVSCVAPTFGAFLMAYGIGFGFSSGALYSHAIACASASGVPNLLVPVTVAAFGLGGVVFGPTSIWLTGLGWSLWSVSPALGCLMVVASVAMLDGANGQENKVETPAEIRFVAPDRQILQLWAIFATGSCAGLIVLGLASKFLVDDPTHAAAAVVAAAAGNTAGRLTAAAVASRFGPVPGIVGALGLTVVALVGLCLVISPGVVVILLFFVALSYGQVAAQTPLLVARQRPGPGFVGAFGWVFTGWGIAGLVGPWSAGWILEVTGDLRPAVIACIFLCLVGVWLATRLPAPRDDVVLM